MFYNKYIPVSFNLQEGLEEDFWKPQWEEENVTSSPHLIHPYIAPHTKNADVIDKVDEGCLLAPSGGEGKLFYRSVKYSCPALLPASTLYVGN